MEQHDEIAGLISRVSLGDREAFRVLYARTSAKLFGVCLRILSDMGEAEDALQEVYIKVWHKAGGYRPDVASPMTWLIAIARNHAIDRLRVRKPRPDDLDAAYDIATSDKTPEEMAINSSEGGRIRDCLGQLDQIRAQAVERAYVEGESYNELAERFKVPLNTMRTWLRRSLLQLRECLGG
jgi:RNA polymerase sigma-70 factor, ECF subfamily